MRVASRLAASLVAWSLGAAVAQAAAAPATDDAHSPSPPPKAEKLHRAQNDGGGETPYKWELSVLSDFYQDNTSDSDGSKNGAGHYDLTARGLYILHHNLEVGASFTYNETAEKFSDGSLDTTTEQLAVLGVYNFGNLDKEVNVAFADGGLAFGMNSQKSTGPDPANVSSTQILLLAGGGIHHFLASRVAATAEAQLQYGTQKPNSGPSATLLNLHLLRLGLSFFL